MSRGWRMVRAELAGKLSQEYKLTIEALQKTI
jgi:hypothetical protein